MPMLKGLLTHGRFEKLNLHTYLKLEENLQTNSMKSNIAIGAYKQVCMLGVLFVLV
jgi:hypothetical protein